jgi:hypothetical protein
MHGLRCSPINASFPFRGRFAREYGRLLYSAKRFIKAMANVTKRMTTIAQSRILLAMGQHSLLFAGLPFIGFRVVATLQTENSVLIPPEAVFAFFARSLFHSRAGPRDSVRFRIRSSNRRHGTSELIPIRRPYKKSSYTNMLRGIPGFGGSWQFATFGEIATAQSPFGRWVG